MNLNSDNFGINPATNKNCIAKTILDVKGEGTVKWNQYLLSNKIYTAAL
jgi:hypothetical protein